MIYQNYETYMSFQVERIKQKSQNAELGLFIHGKKSYINGLHIHLVYLE